VCGGKEGHPDALCVIALTAPGRVTKKGVPSLFHEEVITSYPTNEEKKLAYLIIQVERTTALLEARSAQL